MYKLGGMFWGFGHIIQAHIEAQVLESGEP
jgi:hypothetical protein